MSRPVEPVPEGMADEIVAWIEGGQTLRAFCRQEGKPAWQTVYGWQSKDEAFRERIARARDLGADAIAEEALEIIDTEPEHAQTVGGSHRDSGHVAWLKNRVEMRLKLLAKWNPRKYGDKVSAELTGKDGAELKSGTVLFVTAKPSD